ncbi:VOC family protein [Nocardioides sp. AE5]|uniref:VOC family protein n=1 Tax=Nocardioides sp. AE5 TaxID=2962573 RepID=UPI002880E973|nr:VOC family protein [Nocardioides sp. AE5]MDT0201839.1 VOC family protein [Nocardioides sp. AE5]
MEPLGGASSPKQPVSLNHVAYPTWDSRATYDFYTEVLRCEFLTAISLDAVPSIREETSFLHTFYGFSSGEAIAFFEVRGMKPPQDDGIPKWVRHLALNVTSLDELAAWRQHFKDHGIGSTDIVDHDSIWRSIYIFDPNGIRLELTHQTRPLNNDDRLAGLTVMRDWNAEPEECTR